MGLRGLDDIGVVQHRHALDLLQDFLDLHAVSAFQLRDLLAHTRLSGYAVP